VKTVADKHRLAAYHDELLGGTNMILNDLEPQNWNFRNFLRV